MPARVLQRPSSLGPLLLGLFLLCLHVQARTRIRTQLNPAVSVLMQRTYTQEEESTQIREIYEAEARNEEGVVRARTEYSVSFDDGTEISSALPTTICLDDGWYVPAPGHGAVGTANAAVVCRELNLHGGGTTLPVEEYGDVREWAVARWGMSIALVSCTGDERLLADCSWRFINMDDGDVEDTCVTGVAAAVRCLNNSARVTPPPPGQLSPAAPTSLPPSPPQPRPISPAVCAILTLRGVDPKPFLSQPSKTAAFNSLVARAVAQALLTVTVTASSAGSSTEDGSSWVLPAGWVNSSSATADTQPSWLDIKVAGFIPASAVTGGATSGNVVRALLQVQPTPSRADPYGAGQARTVTTGLGVLSLLPNTILTRSAAGRTLASKWKVTGVSLARITNTPV